MWHKSPDVNPLKVLVYMQVDGVLGVKEDPYVGSLWSGSTQEPHVWSFVDAWGVRGVFAPKFTSQSGLPYCVSSTV